MTVGKGVIVNYHQRYYLKNKEVIKDRAKEYYRDNKKEILAKRAKSERKPHRESKAMNKMCCKTYYERNREEILRKQKIYRDSIKTKQSH